VDLTGREPFADRNDPLRYPQPLGDGTRDRAHRLVQPIVVRHSAKPDEDRNAAATHEDRPNLRRRMIIGMAE